MSKNSVNRVESAEEVDYEELLESLKGHLIIAVPPRDAEGNVSRFIADWPVGKVLFVPGSTLMSKVGPAGPFVATMGKYPHSVTGGRVRLMVGTPPTSSSGRKRGRRMTASEKIARQALNHETFQQRVRFLAAEGYAGWAGSENAEVLESVLRKELEGTT